MKIHHIALVVNKLEESKKFYQENFNFKVAQEYERLDLNGQACLMELGDVMIELWKFEDSKEAGNQLDDIKVKGIRHIAFGVENLDEIIKIFRRKKVPVVAPKLGGSNHRYVFITDPNGIALELFEL